MNKKLDSKAEFSMLDTELSLSKSSFPITYRNLAPGFEKWMQEADKRIFSLAAGNRIAKIAPKIMQVGFAKVLYALNEVGVDIEQTNPYILFAPDGTCSYNPIRTQRGFSYGCIIDFSLDGIMATNNSMPNGCGFSLYELIDPMSDDDLVNYLSDSQMRLGQDQLSQLGKGNHFAGIYYVLDPLSGQDTGRRFIIIHCSGHVGGHRLYHPDSWLSEIDGYTTIKTPHGPITLLESEAKRLYLEQYKETDQANTNNRDLTVEEIFPDKQEWKVLERITHQGFVQNGDLHLIGTQIHEGYVPVAFNPEEGLIVVKGKPNLNADFIDRWDQRAKVDELGIGDRLQNLNFTPHGGGYEFRYPVDQVNIRLNSEGIEDFYVKLDHPGAEMTFSYFREIREWMSYRRKAPIIQEMTKADLATICYELPCLMQIYPLVSIPGGSH